MNRSASSHLKKLRRGVPCLPEPITKPLSEYFRARMCQVPGDGTRNIVDMSRGENAADGLFPPERRQSSLWSCALVFMLTIFIGFPAVSNQSHTHTVEPGESIAAIADYYGVAQRDLCAFNSMKCDKTLKAGHKLNIPKRLRKGSTGHRVKSGDTLAVIAKKHNISVAALMNENKISDPRDLAPGRTLIIPGTENTSRASMRAPAPSKNLVKSGVKIPGGVLHTVQPGQSLWVIARAYNVSADQIRKSNDLPANDSIQVGENLRVPGAKHIVPVPVAGYEGQPIQILRVCTGESATLSLLRSNGSVHPSAQRVLSRLARSKDKNGRVRRLHSRLIRLLQRVAERFPGHTIEIISGYRPKTRGTESRHALGRALDFRLDGVSNRELYDFIKRLPGVGAGYYPNSVFVHLDVRDRRTLWTDSSGPGEEPLYAAKN